MNNNLSKSTILSCAMYDCMPQCRLHRKLAVGVLALGLALSVVSQVKAGTFTVTNTNDNGPGSFRQAILDANINLGKDTINLSSVSGDITPTTPLPSINESVDITGPGRDQLRINNRLFSYAHSSISVDMHVSNLSIQELVSVTRRYRHVGLTIDNVVTEGIRLSYGSLSIFNSVISNGKGISISDYSALLVKDSLITNNTVGVSVFGGEKGRGQQIINSDISNNRLAVKVDGARYAGHASLKIANSTITGNDDAGSFNYGSISLVDSLVHGNGAGFAGGGDGFFVAENSTLTRNTGASLTLKHGYGVYHSARGTIRNSTISNNSGPGIELNGGSISIMNSTISTNAGAGLFGWGGKVDVLSSTITGNKGGIIDYSSYGDYGQNLHLQNSIVAGNSQFGNSDIENTGRYPARIDHSLVQDIGTATIDDVTPAANLFGVHPMLSPLADNGGTTQTHALLAGSPAIDAGDDASCTAADQRGVARSQGAACDIGAFEVDAAVGAGKMGDYVWSDTDSNGKQDSNEPGLANINVQLQNCSGDKLQVTTTDADGSYTFSQLAPDKYRMQFMLPKNYVFSPEKSAGDYRLDSNANVDTGITQCYTMVDGQQRLSIDVGMIPTAPAGTGVLGDYVWSDVNGNGKQDDNETGLANVPINLRTCDGSYLDTTMTGANGGFSFANLAAGHYLMQFHLPKGYAFSPEKAAGNYRLDSNAKPATGLTACYPMADNQERLGIDAGMVPGDIVAADTVTLVKGIYFSADNNLWIRAESDATPAGLANITATMVVNGVETNLGQIGWKADKGFYQQVFKNMTVQPDLIILTSDQGGVNSGLVEIQ